MAAAAPKSVDGPSARVRAPQSVLEVPDIVVLAQT